MGRATLARNLQEDMMGCSARDLVIAVCSHFKNFPVTAGDAKLAETIYDPSIAGVRGKTVRQNEPAFEVEIIPRSVASKYKMITLATDIYIM